MTGKEAAQQTREAAKHGWSIVKTSPWAVSFMALGGVAWTVAQNLEQTPDWLRQLFSASGVGTACLGFVSVLMEHYSKRTSDRTTEDVSDRVWKQIGGIQTAINESLLPEMARLSRSLEDRENEHTSCLNEHREATERLTAEVSKHRGYFEQVESGLKAVNPGWRLSQG